MVLLNTLMPSIAETSNKIQNDFGVLLRMLNFEFRQRKIPKAAVGFWFWH